MAVHFDAHLDELTRAKVWTLITHRIHRNGDPNRPCGLVDDGTHAEDGAGGPRLAIVGAGEGHCLVFLEVDQVAFTHVDDDPQTLEIDHLEGWPRASRELTQAHVSERDGAVDRAGQAREAARAAGLVEAGLRDLEGILGFEEFGVGDGARAMQDRRLLEAATRLRELDLCALASGLKARAGEHREHLATGHPLTLFGADLGDHTGGLGRDVRHGLALQAAVRHQLARDAPARDRCGLDEDAPVGDLVAAHLAPAAASLAAVFAAPARSEHQ